MYNIAVPVCDIQKCNYYEISVNNLLINLFRHLFILFEL